MTKVEKILELISEKSRGLQEEYSDLIARDYDQVEVAENLGGQTVLDELYNEVKLIQKQDD